MKVNTTKVENLNELKISVNHSALLVEGYQKIKDLNEEKFAKN